MCKDTGGGLGRTCVSKENINKIHVNSDLFQINLDWQYPLRSEGRLPVLIMERIFHLRPKSLSIIGEPLNHIHTSSVSSR